MQIVQGLLLLFALIEGTVVLGLDFKNHMSLNGKGEVSWLSDATTITFRAEVATQGWLGIGFSPEGRMKGADIVVGFIDKNGKPQIHDYHGVGHEQPVLDSNQDLKLIDGHKNATHTVITFSRKLDTGDSNDHKFVNGNTNMIWALDNEVPKSETNFNYHSTRGIQRNVDFLKKKA